MVRSVPDAAPERQWPEMKGVKVQRTASAHHTERRRGAEREGV
jgi:hypothetical protein